MKHKKLIALFLLFIFLVNIFPVYATSIKEEETLYAEGLKSFNTGKYEAAIVQFDLAIKLNPNMIKAYETKAEAYYALGDYNAAITSCDAVISRKSNPYYAWFRKGASLYRMSEYQDAINAFDKGISLNATYQPLWVNKGDALVKLLKYNDAVVCFDQADKLLPDSTLVSRGNMFLYQDKFSEALAYYTRAIEKKPDDANTLLKKGYALHGLDRLAECIEVLKAFIKLNAEVSIAYYELSIVYAENGNNSDAIASLSKAVSLDSFYAAEAKDEKAFDAIRDNIEFVYIVMNAYDQIDDTYFNASILNKDLLAGVSFLKPDVIEAKSELDKATTVANQFLSDLSTGNIYNESTATIHQLSTASPVRKEMIAGGRAYKLLSLVGVNSKFTLEQTKVLYAGWADEILKAVILQIDSSVQLDGTQTKATDTLVLIQENGTWKIYQALYKVQDDQ